MLVQMPRGLAGPTGGKDARGSSALEAGQFESGLSRDLAGAALISYNPVLGGWAKRSFDIAILVFFAPAWLGMLAVQALSAKRRKTPAFAPRDFVGYGARRFRTFIAYEVAANDADDPSDARSKRRALLARLPQLWSVLRGDMSLVGPRPLTAEEVAGLRSGVRHYLSMRPGLFGVAAIADAETEESAHYKAYLMSWSVLADAMILWQELRSL